MPHNVYVSNVTEVNGGTIEGVSHTKQLLSELDTSMTIA